MSNNDSNDDSTVAEQTIERLKLDRAKTRLKGIKILSLTGIASLTLIGVGGWLLTGHSIEIAPATMDQIKVFGVSLVGFGIVFSPATIWFVKRLWNPDLQYLYDINAIDEETPDLWVSSPQNAEELTVREGRLHKFQIHGSPCWVGRDFNPEDGEITGTWRGAASDTEIMNNEQEIRANRGRNRYWARVGQEFSAKLPSIIDNIESRVWQSIGNETVDLTAHDSRAVRDEIMNEIDSLEDVEAPDSVEQTGFEEAKSSVSRGDIPNEGEVDA
ncbi:MULTISPECIES: hypothetical protein [Halorussus]|uniref:Uncharacterized protein n=2 Tax=Halorussus TaxID=1070314 RepID=A0A8U0HUI9_9EURY|nr:MULTISPECIES: hypothetical protein [Halorussus]UPV74577.1 hypothetical protein M0R89_00565 [Halorussus limi]